MIFSLFKIIAYICSSFLVKELINNAQNNVKLKTYNVKHDDNVLFSTYKSTFN